MTHYLKCIWLVFCVLLCLTSYAQEAFRKTSSQAQVISASERQLVESSRAAILSTGISATYFEEHFRLVRVLDLVSDRRVEWQYSIGDYKSIINDEVGFYTDSNGRRINSHSIRNILSTAHDIRKTIPKKRAEQLMVRCIGKYMPGGVVFQSFGPRREASLLFTASSIPKSRTQRSDPERRESRGDDKKPITHDGKPHPDSTQEMEDEGNVDLPLIYTGFINLETGVCTKGIAQAGHPLPLRQ